jgi:hypothetical protein
VLTVNPTENPWASRPTCDICSDHRSVINKFHKAAPCPSCGSMSDADYDALRKRMFKPLQPEDVTSQLDMTLTEIGMLKHLKAEHPNAHNNALFSWIEARRYDPSKDPAVRRKVDGILSGWKARQVATAAERGEKWEPGP